MKLVKNDTVLFLGDSITDCDRDRQNPHDLGHGFARLVADQLAEKFPTADFTFYNRGIGGNKAADVLARLQEDCLQLAPDVLVFDWDQRHVAQCRWSRFWFRSCGNVL